MSGDVYVGGFARPVIVIVIVIIIVIIIVMVIIINFWRWLGQTWRRQIFDNKPARI